MVQLGILTIAMAQCVFYGQAIDSTNAMETEAWRIHSLKERELLYIDHICAGDLVCINRNIERTQGFQIAFAKIPIC